MLGVMQMQPSLSHHPSSLLPPSSPIEQDASTASLVWTITLMAEHPDVLARVREEQERFRDGDMDAPITGEQLNEMKYTRQVRGYGFSSLCEGGDGRKDSAGAASGSALESRRDSAPLSPSTLTHTHTHTHT
jgi:hypothetical protein